MTTYPALPSPAYVLQIETELTALRAENERLEKENKSLRKELAALEADLFDADGGGQ